MTQRRSWKSNSWTLKQKENSRLRHAQDKANQETKMANMQKQMEEFQRKLQGHPKTILLPSSRESTIVGEPRGSRPGGQVTFGSTDNATGEPRGSRPGGTDAFGSTKNTAEGEPRGPRP